MRNRFLLACWIVAALAAGSAVPPARAQEPWAPYLDDDGERKEMGDPLKLGDKQWMDLRFTDFPGMKSRIGVLFTEGEAAVSPKYKKGLTKLFMSLSGKPENVAEPQKVIEDFVRSALLGTNRFVLVERTTATGDIAAENALADSGRVESSTAHRYARAVSAGRLYVARFVGADYLVKATLL